MKKTTVIIIFLLSIILFRECQHANRRANTIKTYNAQIELMQDKQTESFNDGFNACLAQF